MLDTDIASYAMKRANRHVIDRLVQTVVGEVCLSVIARGELLYGAFASPRRSQIEAALHVLFAHVGVMDLTDEAVSHYADIRATLKVRGTIIGSNALWIAAHARSLGLILVSNNVREYGRVPGLKIENWTDPQP
jgi:tRNA(fMet)-specific endonuclease VapC